MVKPRRQNGGYETQYSVLSHHKWTTEDGIRLYLIGSNNTQTKFRVLKIDRTESHSLNITDDKVEYSQRQIKELLSMINEGNRAQSGQRQMFGLSRTVSAFGIVGFVRFLEGYYIILVTKRRKVAVIGLHTIYKVEDTTMIYIPHDSVRKHHDDEPKYVRLFQNIDLSSNFYFSYSYDLTHSLQYNMSPPRDIPHELLLRFKSPSPDVGEVEKAEDFLNLSVNSKDSSEEPGKGFSSQSNIKSSCNGNDTTTASESQSQTSPPGKRKKQVPCSYGIRNIPNNKYVWNAYLLKPVERRLHPAWILPITHGFVAQSNISVYGRSFFLTLIARRSCRYAGTRFLKRGANFEGDVANEVETEQLVCDAHVTSLLMGRFTSFVQIRGSIPSHWSQDVSKMVPKPPITFDVMDPFAETAGKHFNELLRRFGSPIIILNLVKRRERRPHESILNTDYCRLIDQLNITLPPQHHIQYVAVDMARINKQNFTLTERHGRMQTGVVRVNCVDCLDRTNTAQFCLGKCALAFQLYSLGVLERPALEFDSDCVRMLEEMYEDHGDTLALQYGGSQLVHRIKTYRRTAPWTSQGNDIMQTLSRYYSNTFSDTEKQNAINLFLGVYIPREEPVPIWELSSDYLLHHTLTRGVRPCHSRSTSQWWDSDVMETLPVPVEQARKSVSLLLPVSSGEPKIDLYTDHHRPSEFCILSELFSYHMSHSVRDYMPNFTTDESPFSVRRRPGKRQEELSRNQSSTSSSQKNPGMTGQASTSSTTSSGTSSTESEASDEDELSVVTTASDDDGDNSPSLSLVSFFPPMTETYGDYLHEPSRADNSIYKRQCTQPPDVIIIENFLPCPYFSPHHVTALHLSTSDCSHIPSYSDWLLYTVPHFWDSSLKIFFYHRYEQIYKTTSCPVIKMNQSTGPAAPLVLIQRSSFCLDSSVETDPPTVGRRSRDLYNGYVSMASKGSQPPANRDLLMYRKFASFS
ncbi:Polyphosphoinositide phosphatase-like [Homarus americanus]|uniref:Polyphosphoinositide phosphatase-like n=1 Tax=Homarus americanus TaxID=6706 RepID=A0A8J5MQY2_HOMAM|nr:Polyphosphoinositide phosphatase-like [Homarus americanus]